MASFTPMDIDQHTLVYITDAGRDPDDCAAGMYLAAYMKQARSQFDKLVFVCVGGDDPMQNAKILGKCIDSTSRVDVYKASGIYLVAGAPTMGGHAFEYGKDVEYDVKNFKPLEERLTGNLSILVAGPPVGIDFSDFIDWTGTMLHSCVFVGDKPTEKSLGVNGGGCFTDDDDKAEVLKNLMIINTQLGEGHNIVYLPRSFTMAQPMTMQTLKRYSSEYIAELYVHVTSKYLLGPRPVHLPPKIQLRIAESNLISIKNMCEAWPKESVRPADAINDPAFVKAGLLYSNRTDFGKDRNLSIMDIPDMEDDDKGKMRARLAEVTAQIFTCQAFINTLGFTGEAAETPAQGLARYMSSLPKSADIPLMPYYDGIGAAVICMMSRDNRNGMVFKSFENAFSGDTCPENERYPMAFIQAMLHFELNKF